MSLSTGTRLGPYEVVAPLGKGGMGEVYRARDTRLHREVAIKTLPAAFAEDPNRMGRFQREAQVLASLSHPNIAAVYGLEEDRGVRALVMELVEGPTLAERIALGPIPLEEALGIARQTGAAIEAAHEKGVVHRDLKPANIKLAPDGKVKVLDFGLAKAFEGEASSGDPANSPTLTLEATRAGVILGTAGYMSPEQARGKPVDKRADIWAFGVVLFEMLSGRTIFEGETISDTLAAVLRADIDWKTLPAGTPPKVRRLLERCLERDPKRRLRDIGDAWLEIDAPEDAAPAAVAPQETRPAARWLPWIAAAVLAGAGIAWGVLGRSAPPPAPVSRWAEEPKAPLLALALSRDGTRLASTEVQGTTLRLWLRMLDQFEAKPLPGGEDGVFPVFSPDAQWIAYVSTQGSKIKKIPITGGTAITLCEGGVEGSTLTWGDDDTIVFAGAKGLMRVPAAGGAPQGLTTVNQKSGETAHLFPSFLPGSRALLFTIGTGGSFDTARIALLDLKSGKYRTVVTGGTTGRYVPSGHLVYRRGDTLFAVPFDLKRLAVAGPEAPVIEGVSSYGPAGFSDYTFSDSGLLCYVAGGQQQGTKLAWADRQGVVHPLSDQPRLWGTGRLSPDGLRVANGIHTDSATSISGDVWIYEVERGTMTRLTFEGANDNPVWTPDGRRVAFSSMRVGKHEIDWVPADGSGKAELLAAVKDAAVPNSWSPDGKTLVFTLGSGPKSRLFVLGRGSGEGQPRPLHELASAAESDGQVSPDGHWIAYVSSESGNPAVYVQPFPGSGAKVRISPQMGTRPRWSRDGRELFYWQNGAPSELNSVAVRTAGEFRAGEPQIVLKMVAGTTWDPAPDGKRFLVEIIPGTLATTSNLRAVVNWFEELRRRAPIHRGR